jgi:ketosteroid isomerase-like protein
MPLVTLTVLASGFMAAQTSAAADLSDVLNTQNEAQNRGDVAAVMATYADNATVEAGGLCMPCVGKAAIQQEVERRVSQNTQVEVLSISESGDTATGVLHVVEAGFAACGVERILVNFTFVVENDTMTNWTSGPDLSDEQSAKFIACIVAGGAGGPPVMTPPSTGNGGLK